MKYFLSLILFLACSPAFSKTITASGGTNSSVQTAIDSAVDGDTVMIPSGNFSWANGINLKKPIQVFGAGDTTNIQNTGDATLVSMTPSSRGSVEFGKVKFTRNGSSTGLYIFAADAPGKPMLVHDAAFETSRFGTRSIDWGTNGGVIYDCTFVSLDKSDNSGIAFKNPSSDSAWHEVDCMGMADTNGDKNTYLEDCTFKDIFLQALDFDDNSRTVMRHCTFDNSAIASHGQETSSVGARQWEVYENTFIFTGGSNNNPSPQQYPLNMNLFLFIRGGGPGVCFNNKIPDISSSAWGNKAEIKFNLYNIRRRGQVPCQTEHPAARQIGWGSDASGKLVLSPVYFWGNTGTGNYNNPALEDYNPDECGSNLHTADFVQKNREFYVNTPKPGYTPFTYPHPLRSGSGPQPTPTAQPTATPVPPTPSPTAQPTATPQPTPTPPPASDSYRAWLDQLARWIQDHPARTDGD